MNAAAEVVLAWAALLAAFGLFVVSLGKLLFPDKPDSPDSPMR